VLDVECDHCEHCGAALHICDHRFHRIHTLQHRVRSPSGWFSGKGDVGRLEG
jgi:hypothetical protein